MKARFIEVIGTRVWLRRYSSFDNEVKCIDGAYHNAQTFVMDIEKEKLNDPMFHKSKEELLIEYPLLFWPEYCEHCDYEFTDNDEFQLFRKRKYNTESGMPEAGDLYYADWFSTPHLYGITPNGKTWDIDGRANNCTMPNDNVHRCWTRKGEPPNVDVGKQYGPTCQAGAGSIAVPGWRGFLRNGIWVQC